MQDGNRVCAKSATCARELILQEVPSVEGEGDPCRAKRLHLVSALLLRCAAASRVMPPLRVSVLADGRTNYVRE